MRVEKFLICLNRMIEDKTGASLMETAITLPVLAFLVMGASDLAMGFSQKLTIQQAAARSIEMATAGGVSSATLTTIRAEAASAAGVSTDKVTIDSWLECNGTRQSSFDGVCTTGQQVARFVAINISGSYTPMFSFVVPRSMTNNGSVSVTGYSSVRVQ